MLPEYDFSKGVRGKHAKQLKIFIKGKPQPMLTIRESVAGCTLAVRVQPRAKRNAIAGEIGGALKIALTAPPVEGAANVACIEFLAKLLKLPRSSVSIAAGESSRNKLIRIAGITADELRARLRAAGVQL